MLTWLSAVLASADAGGRAAEDAACVARLASGDAAAVAALYDRHARAVYSLALRIVGEEADAEDVVQEVFAQVWRTAASYASSRGTVAAWLLTIARSRALDRLRARRARPDLSGPSDENVMRDLMAPAVDPVAHLSADEEARRVRMALARLPLLQRLAIELAYFEGLSQREIAERLEQPLGSVKTRIRMGLMRLRDALQEEGA